MACRACQRRFHGPADDLLASAQDTAASIKANVTQQAENAVWKYLALGLGAVALLLLIRGRR